MDGRLPFAFTMAPLFSTSHLSAFSFSLLTFALLEGLSSLQRLRVRIRRRWLLLLLLLRLLRSVGGRRGGDLRGRLRPLEHLEDVVDVERVLLLQRLLLRLLLLRLLLRLNGGVRGRGRRGGRGLGLVGRRG